MILLSFDTEEFDVPREHGVDFTLEQGMAVSKVGTNRILDVLTVSVDVKNTGSRAGKEAVLLYSSDLVASIVPDNKRLRDFTKI